MRNYDLSDKKSAYNDRYSRDIERGSMRLNYNNRDNRVDDRDYVSKAEVAALDALLRDIDNRDVGVEDRRTIKPLERELRRPLEQRVMQNAYDRTEASPTPRRPLGQIELEPSVATEGARRPLEQRVTQNAYDRTEANPMPRRPLGKIELEPSVATESARRPLEQRMTQNEYNRADATSTTKPKRPLGKIELGPLVEAEAAKSAKYYRPLGKIRVGVSPYAEEAARERQAGGQKKPQRPAQQQPAQPFNMPNMQMPMPKPAPAPTPKPQPQAPAKGQERRSSLFDLNFDLDFGLFKVKSNNGLQFGGLLGGLLKDIMGIGSSSK
ncbi:hypothetical protein [Thiolinea disciformis]|uniref:hypothetical protein n=1 Tax=Thiolinea disciformis TaxID=125614 RepID=UPI0003700772|nr:hypothetical protein [Thiolinea disciformis]